MKKIKSRLIASILITTCVLSNSLITYGADTLSQENEAVASRVVVGETVYIADFFSNSPQTRLMVSDSNAYDWDNTTNRYGGQLSGDTAWLYNQIYTLYMLQDNFEETAEITFDHTDTTDTNEISSKCNTALYAFVLDYPEVFWLEGYTPTFCCTAGNNELYTFSYISFETDASYGLNPVEMDASRDELLESIDEYITTVNSASSQFRFNSQYDKVKFIFNALRGNITYNEYAPHSQTAYGALVDEECVCAGYSMGFKLLCDKMGITCIKVDCRLQTAEHAVNFVKLEDNWYYTDPTNDVLLRTMPSYIQIITPGTWIVPRFESMGYPTISDSPYYSAGDVDLDNVLATNDYTITLQHILNPENVSLNERQKIRADMDFNGILTSNDASIIFQMVLEDTNIYSSTSLGDIINGEEIILSTPTPEIDLNNDGKISAYDIALSLSASDNSRAVIDVDELRIAYNNLT